jgi:hypothetical protein
MNSRTCHIIWCYCCPYTGISIQFTVTPLLFHISRQFDVRYNPLIVPYTPHVTRFSLYQHWTLSCYMILTLFICRYKYQFTVSPSLFTCLDKSICRIIPSWCRIHRISLALVYITTRSCHIILFYHCSYTGMSTQFTVSPSLYHISRQFDVRYNLLVVPYINAFHYD